MFSQSDSEFSLCSAVQSSDLDLKRTLLTKRWRRLFSSVWCGCQLIDFFYIFGGGWGGWRKPVLFSVFDQVVVILYLCLGWKKPVLFVDVLLWDGGCQFNFL